MAVILWFDQFVFLFSDWPINFYACVETIFSLTQKILLIFDDGTKCRPSHGGLLIRKHTGMDPWFDQVSPMNRPWPTLSIPVHPWIDPFDPSFETSLDSWFKFCSSHHLTHASNLTLNDPWFDPVRHTIWLYLTDDSMLFSIINLVWSLISMIQINRPTVWPYSTLDWTLFDVRIHSVWMMIWPYLFNWSCLTQGSAKFNAQWFSSMRSMIQPKLTPDLIDSIWHFFLIFL